MSENDNHPQEYTPTTEQVISAFGIVEAELSPVLWNHPHVITKDRFLRWLAAHDAEVRAKAWDEGWESGTQYGRMPSMYGETTNPHRLLSPSTPNPETDPLYGDKPWLESVPVVATTGDPTPAPPKKFHGVGQGCGWCGGHQGRHRIDCYVITGPAPVVPEGGGTP
jgi:hypothetical protein